MMLQASSGKDGFKASISMGIMYIYGGLVILRMVQHALAFVRHEGDSISKAGWKLLAATSSRERGN